MIKILGGSEAEQHDYYELLRIIYPFYEDNGLLSMKLYTTDVLFNWEITDNEVYFKGSVSKLLDEKQRRRIIKKKLLFETSFQNKINTSWGTLVGIRPTKLALELRESFTIEETKRILKNEYSLSNFAIDLLIDIVEKERNIINKIPQNSYSIYVHIPFCPTKCSYCSYPTIKTQKRDLVEKYVDTLLEEIEYYRERFLNAPVSIYIGGGTPTAIPDYKLMLIIDKLKEVFKVPVEFTVEGGRPDTISRTLLKEMRLAGVNRISINPQTMVNKTLDAIGRTHSAEDIAQSVYLAKELEFHAINMDLIIGLPNESKEEFYYSLEKVTELNPDNITVHSLSIKNGSVLRNTSDMNYLMNYNNYNEVLERSISYLKEKNYLPYYMYRQKRTIGNGINIGYSKPKLESLYNILMMEEKQSIIGLGMSSTTKLYFPKDNSVVKKYQYKNMRDYCNNWKNKQLEKDTFINRFNF